MPLYVFYGKDTLSRKEALDALKRSLDSGGALATNTTFFEAGETTPQEVMAACDTAPFLGERRLVILYGALKGRRPRARKGGEPPAADLSPWGVLADYAGRLPPTTVLVLVDDEAGALRNALKEKAEVREFKAPDVRTLPGWVMNRAKVQGLKLDARAARLLAELIGPDPWMIASELDKLAAYAAGEVIREDDVRALVSRAKERRGYELTDAVADRQAGKAMRILSELLEDGEPEPVLLSTMAGRYRRMAIAREMAERGEPESAIARRIGMAQNYGFTRLMEQAMKYPPASILNAYERLIRAEIDVKSGLTDYRLALEMAVQELAARSMRAREAA